MSQYYKISVTLRKSHREPQNPVDHILRACSSKKFIHVTKETKKDKTLHCSLICNSKEIEDNLKSNHMGNRQMKCILLHCHFIQHQNVCKFTWRSIKSHIWGGGCNSILKHLPRICKALGLISITAKKKKGRLKICIYDYF